jgi:hypothetical protein
VNECHSPKPTATAADIVSVLVEDSDEHDLYGVPLDADQVAIA